MSLPALKAFKEQRGGHLTYAVDLSVSCVLCHLAWIDNVVDYRTVELHRYDEVFDISSLAMEYEYPGRPIRNRIDIYGDALRVQVREPLPQYVLSSTESASVVGSKTQQPTIVVSVDTLDPVRDWPIESWRVLVGLLTKQGYRVLVSDLDPTRRWDDLGGIKLNCSFRELGAILTTADLFVGGDSGPMHLAGALRIKSIVLFGAIPPGARLNHYPTHRAIQSPTACQGWHRQHCGSRCCMGDLTPQYIFQEIVLALTATQPLES